MRCPKCASEKVHIVETTNTTNTSGYSCGKGCCGAILFGNILGALCGIGGKTKTDIEYITYWVCDSCGAKFQHGMTDQMFEFKNRMDNYKAPLNFVKLDDSTEQRRKIRISLEQLKLFPDLWDCVSFEGRVNSPEVIKTIGILMFRGTIPDMVCCLTAKKSVTKKRISNIFDSEEHDFSPTDEYNQGPDYGWDLSLYIGIVMLESELLYYNGKETYHWEYKNINKIYATEKDLVIYNAESAKDVSFKDFLNAAEIRGDKMQAFVRFIRGTVSDNSVYTETRSQEINKENGINNKSALCYDGKFYIFTESSSLLENRATLLEINSKGEYHNFPMTNSDTVFDVGVDECFLYFLVQGRICRISWESIKNRNVKTEVILNESGIEGLVVAEQWLYYIKNKNLIRRNITSGVEEKICGNIVCRPPLIRNENRIYFLNKDEKKKLYRFDMQTSGITQVFSEENIGNYTICNNKVFFYKGIVGLKLSSYDMETGESKVIDEMASGLNATSDKVFYQKDNKFIEYDAFNGSKREISEPKDMQVGNTIEIIGDLICCKVRGSISLNYVVNTVTGDGQEI